MYEQRSTIRYRIRNKERLLRENFLPWGLLGLLLIFIPLLFALFWYAKHGIQKAVQTEITQELTSQDLDWVNVEVDGQAVMLTGEGSKLEGERAISLAKKVTDAAWLGQFSVPSKVNGEFSEPASVAVDSAIQPIEIPQPEPEPEPAQKSWGKLINKLDAGVLTLTGTVGSQAEKEALLAAANDRIDPPRLVKIVDEMVVSDQELIAPSELLAKRATDVISECNTGESRSVDGVFSIQCQASRDQVVGLQTTANTAIEGASLGNIAISSADDCNESFANILDGKTIGFAVGSANLKSSSTSLLDQIANLAKSCPGSIRVEGHTDASGNFEANMALSNARAKAVVDALVARDVKSERLSPEGFGSTKPRAQGNTREAYALNRRIEFHVSQ